MLAQFVFWEERGGKVVLQLLDFVHYLFAICFYIFVFHLEINQKYKFMDELSDEMSEEMYDKMVDEILLRRKVYKCPVCELQYRMYSYVSSTIFDYVKNVYLYNV